MSNKLTNICYQNRRELTPGQVQGVKEWLESIGEQYQGHWSIKLRTRRGRLRDRVLVLTSQSFHIIHIDRYLALSLSLSPSPSLFSHTYIYRLEEEESYQPKSVPLSQISEMQVPLFPETNFTVCTARVLHGRDRLPFVLPDRDSLINKFREVVADVQPEGRRIKVRGVDLEEGEGGDGGEASSILHSHSNDID